MSDSLSDAASEASRDRGAGTVVPRYYAVNDRPVVLAPTPDGGLDALVVDWASGALVPDRTYFLKVSEVGIGKDVDQLTHDQFWSAVRGIRSRILARLASSPLPWQATGDVEHPYASRSNGYRYLVRVNDFPAGPIYTVLVDDQELGDLEDWPDAWQRPSGSEDDGAGR